MTLLLLACGAPTGMERHAIPLVPTPDPALQAVRLEESLTFAGEYLHLEDEDVVFVGVRVLDFPAGRAVWQAADGEGFGPCDIVTGPAKDRCATEFPMGRVRSSWNWVRASPGRWNHKEDFEPYWVRRDGTAGAAWRRDELLELLGPIDTAAEALLAARWTDEGELDLTFTWDPSIPAVIDDDGVHQVVFTWQRGWTPSVLTVSRSGAVTRGPLDDGFPAIAPR